jgi:hypothetical protein
MFQLSQIFANPGKNFGNNFGSVFRSPIWTAVITVFIILLIIWFITRNEIEPRYDDTSIWTLLIKIGVWSLLVVGGMQFLSMSAVEAAVIDRYTNKNQREIVHNALDSESTGDSVITPV